jgi:creatinine amidohydrolase
MKTEVNRIKKMRTYCLFADWDPKPDFKLGSIPEGVVGFPSLSEARKARRTIAAILSYLTLVHDEIIEAFPAGKVPPIETTTMRTEKEMEPYLKEPFTEGWRPIYSIPKMGL